MVINTKKLQRLIHKPKRRQLWANSNVQNTHKKLLQHLSNQDKADSIDTFDVKN